ncbi:MAG TPA: ComEC/Rec2 family competence protein, partial [Pyrinomonadaceae bacterium]|nr:ComEC/Rec2 family competence protein [Pyrinomonadaceae bacterium]
MQELPKRKNFIQYPFALLAVGFSVGILVESKTGLNEAAVLAFIVISAAAAYFLRRTFAASPLILIAFVLLGSFCFSQEQHGVRDDRIRKLIDSGQIASGDPVELEGELVGPPELMSDGLSLTLSADHISYRGRNKTASGNVRLFVPISDDEAANEFDGLNLWSGTRVRVACNILREEQYLNRGVQSRLELLDRQGIDATASLKSPLLIGKVSDSQGFSPFSWAYDFRQELITEFRSRFSISTAGVLTASMLGDKYFLDKPTADVFREGGTFHVLVISGLHITFIGGLLLLIVSALTRNRLAQFAVVTVFLWAYTFAVDANAPVVRASLMFTLLLLSRVIYRQSSLLNSLGACVVLLLVWRPSDIFNPSFQLTVVSVAAIVMMAFPLIEKIRAIGSWIPTTTAPFPPNVSQWLRRSCEMLYWQPATWKIEISRQIWTARILKSPFLPAFVGKTAQRIISFIFEGLLVSLIVQLWMLPLLVVYFHRITPISIAMNLWVGIVMAAESISAVIGVFVSNFSEFLAAPFFAATELLNYLLVTLPQSIVAGSWASWRVPNYSGTAATIYVLYFVPVIALALVSWKWGPFELTKSTVQIPLVELKARIEKLIPACVAGAIFVGAIIILHPFS